ncbi:hypothetical protein EMIT0111MI5_220002 [Burkholderia sp. IT-111MI5]
MRANIGVPVDGHLHLLPIDSCLDNRAESHVGKHPLKLMPRDGLMGYRMHRIYQNEHLLRTALWLERNYSPYRDRASAPSPRKQRDTTTDLASINTFCVDSNPSIPAHCRKIPYPLPEHSNPRWLVASNRDCQLPVNYGN